MNLDGLHNVRYAGNLYIGDEENAFDNGKESLLSIELPALETVAGQDNGKFGKGRPDLFQRPFRGDVSIRKRKEFQ